MITIELEGDRRLIAKLDAMPAKVHDALLRKINVLTLKLEAKVKDKLSGKVLNVVTGRLRRSVFSKVTDTTTQIIGTVASSGDVKYAAIHEFGGTTAPHDIFPAKAEALAFAMGGKQVLAKVVHHPGSRIPARPYMLPSLEEMTPEIIDGMKSAVKEGLA